MMVLHSRPPSQHHPVVRQMHELSEEVHRLIMQPRELVDLLEL